MEEVISTIYQNIFERYELKYLLSADQAMRVKNEISPYMALDKYGRTTIRNLYFDTDNYRLIRRSIEKPVYKEKLRIRSYSKAQPNSTVFVELKKKYKSVVYKRRVAMTEAQAVKWIIGGQRDIDETQITREIDYFISYYGNLRPTVFLSYEREAYYSIDGGDFRLTFDENILARVDKLTLEEDPDGIDMMPTGTVLMEIKTAGGIPLWMADILSREHIYKTSFSKYGKAYEKLIYSSIWEAR